jgi:hypothetical protein
MEVSDSFMPWPPYPWEKSPQYPLDRSLNGPQSQSECDGKGKNSLPLPGIKPWSSSSLPNRYNELLLLTLLCLTYGITLYPIKTAGIYGKPMFPKTPKQGVSSDKDNTWTGSGLE